MEYEKEYEYKLVIIGPPGSGKGTISELIEDKLSIPHISTGDMLRDHIDAGDEVGLEIKDKVEHGKLIPDDITEEIIRGRLSEVDVCKKFLLDGFPRDLEQAKFLSHITGLDGVIIVDLDDETIVNRLSQRRICEDCDEGYHLRFKAPEKEGVCDKCGGKLVRRKDDEPEVIRDRLHTYHEKTAPVLEFFEQKCVPSLEIPGDFNLKTESDQIIDQIVQWQESLRE
ncbi:MAG: adenylate kinase family protein [Nanobdellota archaeon]